VPPGSAVASATANRESVIPSRTSACNRWEAGDCDARSDRASCAA
jgi:hypothetical protein